MIGEVTLRAQLWALQSGSEPVPSPSPTPTFDPVAVTPGPAGFLVTAALFLAVGFLVWSLIRRVSRVQHRARVREALEAEMADGAATDAERQRANSRS